jgi:hypothetical protein
MKSLLSICIHLAATSKVLSERVPIAQHLVKGPSSHQYQDRCKYTQYRKSDPPLPKKQMICVKCTEQFTCSRPSDFLHHKPETSLLSRCVNQQPNPWQHTALYFRAVRHYRQEAYHPQTMWTWMNRKINQVALMSRSTTFWGHSPIIRTGTKSVNSLRDNFAFPVENTGDIIVWHINILKKIF